jgi:hypothetical protein
MAEVLVENALTSLDAMASIDSFGLDCASQVFVEPHMVEINITTV